MQKKLNYLGLLQASPEDKSELQCLSEPIYGQ